MRDVVGDYINSIIAEKDTNFVTYLIEDNKTNEEIKKIVPSVDDEFINCIRKASKRQDLLSILGLYSELNKGLNSAKREGWLKSEDVEKELRDI